MLTLVTEKELAKSEESVVPNITKNLAKTGNTPFIVDDIEVEFTKQLVFTNFESKRSSKNSFGTID